MKVSIITVCFNSASTIEETIESVLSQTHRDIEYIVIDGNSSDDTMQIVYKYSNSIAQIISEPDKGMYDALNKGIKMASGDVVGIINADDVFANTNVIQSIVEAYTKSNADIVYGDIKYVSKINLNSTIRYWKAGTYHHGQFFNGWMPPHTGFFITRSDYLQYGMYRLDIGTAADYELMLRMMHIHKLTSYYLPEVITLMRVGGQSNRTLISRWNANRNDLKAWKVNNLKPKLYTLLLKPLSKLMQFFNK